MKYYTRGDAARAAIENGVGPSEATLSLWVSNGKLKPAIVAVSGLALFDETNIAEIKRLYATSVRGKGRARRELQAA